MITADICSNSANEQEHSLHLETLVCFLFFIISYHKGKAKLSSSQRCDRNIFLYVNFLTDLVSFFFAIWQRDQLGMFTVTPCCVNSLLTHCCGHLLFTEDPVHDLGKPESFACGQVRNSPSLFSSPREL